MRLFITGISGLLGLNAAFQFRDRYSVSGVYHSHHIDVSGVRAKELDIRRPDRLDALLREVRPDVVLHAAGLTNVDACEHDPPLAEELNTRAAATVAASARAIGARMIHMSSDHLFSGDSPWVGEEARPRPVNVYARNKAAAEGAVQHVHPEALVIRTNFFGWGTSMRQSFSDWILNSLRANTPLNMFTDLFFTPILVNQLLETIFLLETTGASGIYHIAGGERVSKHAFALRMADHFGLDASLIHASTVDAQSLPAPRPRDLSLSSAKTERLLGKPAPTIDGGLTQLADLERAGWRESLESALARKVD